MLNFKKVQRFLAYLLSFCLLAIPTAYSAGKKITVKSLRATAQFSSPEIVDGAVVSGSTIGIYGVDKAMPYFSGISVTGVEKWRVILGVEAVPTAATVDGAGNFWIVGSAPFTPAAPTPTSTPTPTSAPLNPENISLPTFDPLRSDLTSLVIWQLARSGEILNEFTYDVKKPVLFNSIAVDKNGFSIVGSVNDGLGDEGYLLNSNLKGEFSSPIRIGSSSTVLNGVIRNKDGTQTVIGTSGETIAGKKVQGSSDGIIISIAKSGKVFSVVRSSAPSSNRSWDSTTTALLLGGSSSVGPKNESAITKFSSKLVPKWSYRFASNGSALTSAGVNGGYFALFTSTSPITQLSGWKPKGAQALLLNFDSKGSITAAYSPIEMKQPLSLHFSKVLGVIALGLSGETVSIFTLTSR